MAFKPIEYHPNSFRLFITILCMLLLSSCGGSSSSNDSSSGSGPLSFNVVYHGMAGNSRTQAAVIDCAGEGIVTVEAAVYDSDDTLLRSGGPWECEVGQGTITAVPAGAGRTIVILGRDGDENVVFRGQKSDIQVDADRENDAGTIDCYAFVPVLQAPADEAVVNIYSMGLAWNAVTGAIEYRIRVSENSDLHDAIINEIATTENYMPAGLSNGQTYYWQAIAVDAYGNLGIESQTWSFTVDVQHQNSPPTAEITSPAPNSAFTTEDEITFAGNGRDTEDGDLSGQSLEWHSNLEGLIGTGVSFSTDTLSAGTHQIELTATDSEGATGKDSIIITVTEKIWANTYGPIDIFANNGKVQLTSDGGYIIFGYTSYFKRNDPDGNPDMWVSKLDGDGGVVWEKTYHALGYENISAIEQVAGGGYIISGNTTADIGETVYALIIKVDDNGDLQWSRRLEGELGPIQQTLDEGFILAGTINSDFWVVKMNQTGQITWQKSYGGQSSDTAGDVEQTSDGGYIVAGSTTSSGTGVHECLVMKLNADGSVAWQNTYGGANSDVCSSSRQAMDGGFIVAGTSWSFGAGKSDAWVLKLNAKGDIQWQKTYGGEENDTLRSSRLTQNGGYILIGSSTSFGQSVNYYDGWIISIDADGGILWQKGYGGGTQSDYGVAIHQTPDGGFVAAGAGESYKSTGGDNFGDILMLKMGQDGSIGCGLTYDTTALTFDSSANGAATDVTVRNTSLTTLSTDIEVLDATITVQRLCE